MWKFTLLPGVVRCTAAQTAGAKGKRVARSLLRGGGLLQLFGGLFDLLALVLGRKVDGLLRSELSRSLVARGRGVLDEQQIGLRVVGLGRQHARRLLGLLRLVERGRIE